jgi:hypothetical protein
MAATDEMISFVINQLAIIISLIGSGALFTKWIIKENGKRLDRLEVLMLGKDKDGRPGKGGMIDELRNETRHYADNVSEKNAIRIGYMESSLDRIEKTVNKILLDVKKEDD